MSKVSNINDKLTFVMTEYGMNRIAKALVDETVNLNLTKMRVGDANGEYYVPTEGQTSLVNELPDGIFYIIEKDLLEDGITVSLKTVFPEDFNNCDIREVGLYETVGGIDYLFAISTMQPIVKPTSDLQYLVSVDYYMFLKSDKLSAVFDRIFIDSANASITERDLENLMNTILFTESNLMEQVNGNSRIIGYNRSEQLYQELEKEKHNYGCINSYNNYVSTMELTDADKMYAYWVFNHTNRLSASASVADMNYLQRNLSCNKNINLFEKDIKGFMPLLKFEDNDYYKIAQDDFVVGYNSEVFSKVGNIKVSTLGDAYNYLDKVNYMVTVSTIDLSNPFEVQGSVTLNGAKGALVSNGNFKFIINENTDPENEEGKVFASLYCGEDLFYRALLTLSAKVRYFFKVSFDGTKFKVHWTPNEETLNSPSSLLKFCTEPGNVEITDDNVSTEIEAESSGGANLQVLFGSESEGNNAIDGTFHLSSAKIIVNDEEALSGSKAILENDLSFINEETQEDSDFSIIYALAPINVTSNRTILARSNYLLNNHIFEIQEVYTNNGIKLVVKLFTDTQNYITFETAEGSIPKEAHSVVLSYKAEDNSLAVNVNGNKVNVNKNITGTYSRMNSPTPSIYAFSVDPEYFTYIKKVNSGTTQYVLCNEDGSPYAGTDWYLFNNSVPLYKGNEGSETGATSSTPSLISWVYNDGAANNYAVYTKTLAITKDTPLYNYDLSLYTGSDFKIDSLGRMIYKGNIVTDNATSLYAWVYTDSSNIAHCVYSMAQVLNGTTPLYNADYSKYEGTDFEKKEIGGVYKVFYKENETTYGGKLGSSLTIKEYKYVDVEQTIWTNSPTSPAILFNSEGVKYSGKDWELINKEIVYVPTGAEGERNPSKDIEKPALNAYSYIIDENGDNKDNIGSSVGVLSVIKSSIPEQKMRVIAMQLHTAMGNSPCISMY